jgi:hypothetical protein
MTRRVRAWLVLLVARGLPASARSTYGDAGLLRGPGYTVFVT